MTIGVCVAYVFTRVPTWTAWTLLAVMALYDLYAVLHKQGPLRALVTEALATDGLPPGLVYESRGVRPRDHAWTVRGGGGERRGEVRGGGGKREQSLLVPTNPRHMVMESARCPSVPLVV